MAEINHPGFCNFFPPPRFESVEELVKSFQIPATGIASSGGEYALLEILRTVGGIDAAAGVFARAGRGRSAHRRTGVYRGTTRMRLRLLSLLPVRLCTLRVLWPDVFR